jgi:hypothetical protein
MRKKFNLLQLASKGRKGDTEIRRVDGRLSHVNKTEANWIDIHGKSGEAMTQAVGSGTINPNTGLMEYGFGSWFKKRVTPPKRVRQAVSGFISGDLNIEQALTQGAEGMYEATTRGGGGAWRPSQGKWGIFGSTEASKAADKAKADAAGRKASFEAFMDKYQDENVAAIQTSSTLDDEGNTYTGKDFESFVTSSGISPTGADDMHKYVSEYDPAKEDILDLQADEFEASTDTAAAQNSQGLFGIMSTNAQTQSQQGFASAGNFEQEFARKQAEEQATRTFAGIDRSREEVAINKGIVQNEYNKQFWDDMIAWSGAINA